MWIFEGVGVGGGLGTCLEGGLFIAFKVFYVGFECSLACRAGSGSIECYYDELGIGLLFTDFVSYCFLISYLFDNTMSFVAFCILSWYCWFYIEVYLSFDALSNAIS